MRLLSSRGSLPPPVVIVVSITPSGSMKNFSVVSSAARTDASDLEVDLAVSD